MAADNHTTIVGNLVDDPELRFTNTGIAVANMRVAVTQRIQQDGEWRDGDTSYLKVNVWRGQAEHLADSVAKGDRVMVTGRPRQRSWETPERDKRSVTEIEADEVGASLKWATAKVERTSQRGDGDRAQGRERRPSAAATSTTHPHSEQPYVSAPGPAGGAGVCQDDGPRSGAVALESERGCDGWRGRAAAGDQVCTPAGRPDRLPGPRRWATRAGADPWQLRPPRYRLGGSRDQPVLSHARVVLPADRL
jgi:single-strand DNA-binding protein